MQQRGATVNTSDQSVFSNLSRPAGRLCKNFHISLTAIEDFMESIHCDNSRELLNDIYDRLTKLSSNDALTAKHKILIFRESDRKLLLNFCSDILDLTEKSFKELQDKEVQEAWINATLLSGCVQFPFHLINLQKTYEQAPKALALAASCGRLDLMRYILNPANKFNLSRLDESKIADICKGAYFFDTLRLALAHFDIKNAIIAMTKPLKLFGKINYEDVKKHITQAKEFDGDVCYAFLNDIFLNPDKYGVDKKGIRFLSKLPLMFESNQPQTLIKLFQLATEGSIKLPKCISFENLSDRIVELTVVDDESKYTAEYINHQPQCVSKQ